MGLDISRAPMWSGMESLHFSVLSVRYVYCICVWINFSTAIAVIMYGVCGMLQTSREASVNSWWQSNWRIDASKTNLSVTTRPIQNCFSPTLATNVIITPVSVGSIVLLRFFRRFQSCQGSEISWRETGVSGRRLRGRVAEGREGVGVCTPSYTGRGLGTGLGSVAFPKIFC